MQDHNGRTTCLYRPFNTYHMGKAFAKMGDHIESKKVQNDVYKKLTVQLTRVGLAHTIAIAKKCLITTVDRNGVTEGDGFKKT